MDRYFRIGRVIYREGRHRRVRVYTAGTATEAALKVRALNHGARDWRVGGTRTHS
jgi:hypothetical protein